jgi:hypothetical protein
MIHLLGWGVSEAAPRALEAKVDGDDLGFATGFEGERELVEVLEQDGLDAADVDELEGQGAAAGEVETKPAVLGTETKELLGLAQLGPGHGSGEEFLGTLPDVGPMTLGLADHPLGITERIGSELSGVIVVVRGPATRRLSGVSLHQGSVHIDAHELGVAPDPGRTSEEGVGHGVQRLLEVDVVIGVDLVLAPEGGIEALTLEGEEMGSLHVLEDGQRLLAGGTMDPGAGGLEAPTKAVALHMLSV